MAYGKNIKDLEGYLVGMSVQRPDLTLVVDGTSVYLDVEAVGGGDIDFFLNDDKKTLNCTTGAGVNGKARVEVPQGTATKIARSIIYVAFSEQDNELQLYSTLALPTGSYCPVAVLGIQDYATVSTNGALVMQRTTESIEHNDKGAISWMREKLRAMGAEYWSGVDPHINITTNALSEDNVNFQTTNGIVFQLHRQSFPNYDISTDGIWVYNASGNGTLTPLQRLTDLNQIHEIADGTALVDGDSIVVLIWGCINYGVMSKLYLTLPDKKYTVDSDAIIDANHSIREKVPNDYKTTGFLIAKAVLKYNTADNGTWTNLLTTPVTVWDSITADVSSPNYPSNYNNNDDVTSTLTQTGANSIRVHFDAFNTEANYDFVYLYDGSDVLQYTYHGNLGAFTSGEISGDTVKVRFTSDGSVVRTGFHIDRLEYSTTSVAGAEVIDLR